MKATLLSSPGGASGIWLAIVHALLHAGARPVVIDFDRGGIELLSQNAAGRVDCVALDVADEAAVLDYFCA